MVAAALVLVLSACSTPAPPASIPAPPKGSGATVLWNDGTLLGYLPALHPPTGALPVGDTAALLAEVALEAAARGISTSALAQPATVLTTTLSRGAEQLAQQSTVRAELLDTRKRVLAGLVVLKPSTGEIVAVAGTAEDGRLLAVTPVQTGSVFKLFTLLAAARAGIPLTARFDASSPQTLRGGTVISNHSAESSSGSVTLQTATAHSLNVVFAKLAVDQLGLPAVIAAAHAAGIPETVTPSPLDPFTSLGVTPMAARDVAAAYATVQSGGLRCQVHLIASSSADGLATMAPCQRAFEPDVVAEANQALRGVVDEGTGSRAQLPGRVVAGKTGTAQGNQSAWFAGSTGDLTAVALVVGSRHRPLRDVAGLAEVTGSSLPTDIWHSFVTAYLKAPKSSGPS